MPAKSVVSSSQQMAGLCVACQYTRNVNITAPLRVYMVVVFACRLDDADKARIGDPPHPFISIKQRLSALCLSRHSIRVVVIRLFGDVLSTTSHHIRRPRRRHTDVTSCGVYLYPNHAIHTHTHTHTDTYCWFLLDSRISGVSRK